MKKIWKIAGIATLVAVLGVAALGAIAFAQEETADWPFNFRERMHEAIARNLGISVEEYEAAVETAQGQVLDEAVAEGWLTEDQAERMREQMAEGNWGAMRGVMGRNAQFMRQAAGRTFINTAAEALDMTPQDLLAALREGQSIADIAAEQGVDTQVIVDAQLAQIQERLDQAVADGKITQQRADWMLSQAETRMTEMLDRTWEGNPAFGGKPGRGFLRHGKGAGGFPGGGFQGPHGQPHD